MVGSIIAQSSQQYEYSTDLRSQQSYDEVSEMGEVKL